MWRIRAKNECQKSNSWKPSKSTPAWSGSCSRVAQNSQLKDPGIEMDRKTPVGVLGATGMVGQHFVNFLQNHPWFEITWVGASDRSAGKKYCEATNWRLEGAMPTAIAGLTVADCKPGTGAPELVFSAMDASVATEIERAFAEAGHTVVSNSKNHRMDRDVPLLVPEINYDHLRLIEI